jgi:putative Mg2+ transporter-C (MgtC) family protein
MDIEWQAIIDHLIRLGVAFVLALPVAWNREEDSRSAGLRTFPLVSIAACAYMLVGLQVMANEESEARVLYGIITGMGFIGGGAILKNNDRVAGTATAASLWNTGAIGISVAYSRFEIALVLSLVNFAILAVGTKVKQRLE